MEHVLFIVIGIGVFLLGVKGSVYPDSVYRADRGRAYGIQDLLWRRQIWHTKGRCTCFYLYLSGR